MDQNPTFGCGTFLPGEGPGNLPEFTGGGTIDGGNGNNGGDPPDPPIQIDPDEEPTRACACIPNPGYTENIQYDGNSAQVTRIYSQTCTRFSDSSEAAAAASIARQNIRNQSPPPGGGWVADGSVDIIGGPIGGDCKTPNGTCGGACANVIVISRWLRPITPGGGVPPSPTGDTPGPAQGPPATTTPPPPPITPGDLPPTPTPPPPPPPPEQTFPCKCMVTSLQPSPKRIISVDENGCRTWLVQWRYTCRENNNDPLADKDPYEDWPVPAASPGYAINGQPKRRKYYNGSTPCGGVSPCSNSLCETANVTWVECPNEEGEDVTPGPDLGQNNTSLPGLITDDPNPGGNGITPGPDIGAGASPNSIRVGGGLIRDYTFDESSLRRSVINQDINLNDPTVIRKILKFKPNGIQESAIFFDKNPETPKLVENDTEFTELFNEKIDSNIYYILKNKNNTGNWDSTKAAGVTPDSVLASLKPQIRNILDKIRNYDGTKLNQNQIFSMIGSRILDGSIASLTTSFLQSLASDSEQRVPSTITKSNINKVNEIAALILIDDNKIPLDTSKLGGREQHIFKNFKILSSDIDKFLPITINGESRRFYINDDDTFIDRETLSIKDGDYFDVISGGKATRIFTGSEIDHAFLIPENIRQQAISLLGGEPGRTLSVSGNKETASAIEYDSSLSTPRQPFYVLSAVLNSVQTSPSFGGSFLLKDTTLRYQLMDTSTVEGLNATNEFIKYKANKRIFILDHEDLILDYLEATESVNLKQTDIIFNSPKINKGIPLLVRQIPFYIMIYPTNRSEYNIFNDKSRILEIANDGAVTRQLKCSTHINPEFTQSQTNKFIKYRTDGRDAVDVLGIPDTQTRISFIDPDDEIFKTGFEKGNNLVPASEYDVDREKTGFRLLREIINELDTNYELSINGVGKTITEFDAFSRLNLKQFNILSRLENFSEIDRAISNGLINDVKLIPPIEHADTRILIKKTQLVQRKTTATTDTFKPIKATGDGVTIISPDEKGEGGFGPA